MKSNFLVTVLLLLSINMFSQATYYPLVKGSGDGESTITDLNYSHHTNYLMRILNLTVKWKLYSLFGEPVVDGVFKWKAASDTPEDYLDYRDYVLLECSPVKSFGYSVYIKLTPIVPKSGDGYGFNTPGSPSWANLFCTRKGEDMTREVPAFNAATAKEIWKGGFRITGVVLLREGGKDGFLKPKSTNTDDFWNTPENTTTTQQQTQEIKQKEAVERQKQLKEQARAKYNALKNPYAWNVTNQDTVFDAGVQLLKNLNPYFDNGTITLSSVSKGKVTGTTNNITTNLHLTEGWNTLRVALKGTNYNLKDSVKVFYNSNPLNLFAYFDEIEKKYGFKNAEGHIKIYPKYKNAKHFSEGLGAIENEEGKWGFINSNGRLIIDYQFDNVGRFSEGLVWVKNSDKGYKYINHNGIIVISNLNYNNVGDFENGKAKVCWSVEAPPEKMSKEHIEENRRRRENGESEIRYLTLTSFITKCKYIDKFGNNVN